MRHRDVVALSSALTALSGGLLIVGLAWGAQERPKSAPPDAVVEAQSPRGVAAERPEQKATEHDRSGVFSADNAPNSSPAFENQPAKGRIDGFDFYRDPLNAMKPKE